MLTDHLLSAAVPRKAPRRGRHRPGWFAGAGCYWNRLRMLWAEELAIESAWMPSCCCV